MVYITRGTTPTIELEVDADLTDFECVLSIGKPRRERVAAVNPQKESTEHGMLLSFRLTQEQTLCLSEGSQYMQLRGISGDDAIATEMINVMVREIIRNELIDDGD